jgi:hypothetical protein
MSISHSGQVLDVSLEISAARIGLGSSTREFCGMLKVNIRVSCLVHAR